MAKYLKLFNLEIRNNLFSSLANAEAVDDYDRLCRFPVHKLTSCTEMEKHINHQLFY